jgi:two-component system osmolarity sensor histidine kinase EnvZ
MAMSPDHWLKRFLPKTLLGRSLLIIVTPLVLLQVVSAFIFFENHWDKVSRRLSLSVAGDVAAIADMLRRYPGPEHRDWIFSTAERRFHINADFADGAILKPSEAETGLLGQSLHNAMWEISGRPFRIDTNLPERRVRVQVQLPNGVLSAEMSRKRLFSSTTYIFVIWMVGTSLLLLGVATIFMRNQVRPIRRLAAAANAFGKGRDLSSRFKPEGAAEVRQAASAFLSMRERIQRQMQQRTDMLSGVSHDLRTPLTRMRLQLAVLEGKAGGGEGANGGANGGGGGLAADVAALQDDIGQMERMLDEYLDYARGAGAEKVRPTDLSALLGEVVDNARRGVLARRAKDGGAPGGAPDAAVDLHVEGEMVLPLRAQAFRRCLQNLLDNAVRYGEHVAVRAGRRTDPDGTDVIEVTVDDDGPGIPEDKRDDVFRPFVRLDGSRNPGTGGVGLGLSIVRDVVRAQGGDAVLEDAPIGGLRVRLRLPV